VLLVLPGGLAQVTAGLRKRVFSLVARIRRIELPGAGGLHQPPPRQGEQPPDSASPSDDTAEILMRA
jgi:hypothetical protein